MLIIINKKKNYIQNLKNWKKKKGLFILLKINFN